MALYLQPLRGGKQILLDKAVLLVGRQSDCDVILTQSRKVSRKHCCIVQVNDRFLVRDLASMNGVRVNGRRIDRVAEIQVGDEIFFGDVAYVLKDSAAEAKRNGGPAPSAADAEKEPAPSSAPSAQPQSNISRKFPVPIAEENIDFAVEPSIQLERLSDSPLENEDDRLSLDAGSSDEMDEFIVLEDSDELPQP